MAVASRKRATIGRLLNAVVAAEAGKIFHAPQLRCQTDTSTLHETHTTRSCPLFRRRLLLVG